jgi:ribosomal-protein-alanine N-acetyltransferase
MSDSAANLIIRPMTTADLDCVVAIAASLPHAPHWPRSAYLDALNPESAPRRIALIASEADSIVGFAIASLLAPQAELETIAIAPVSQRRGLGRRLFNALADQLGQAGVREVLLELRASNLPAHGFYRSLGFVQSGMRRAYYADPVEDAVLMRMQTR